MAHLCIDTSSPIGSLALISHDGPLNEVSWSKDSQEKKGSHSEVITTQFTQLLQKASLDIHSLEGLIVSIGPGSFTGLRVGINFCKSLSYSLNIPIYGINSLEAWALSVSPEEYSSNTIVVMTNAFKNMVFFSSFKANASVWREVVSPRALKLNELEEHISTSCFVVGDGFSIYADHLPSNVRSQLTEIPSLKSPQASLFGQSVLTNRDRIQTFDWKDLRPLYIKQSSAEEKLKEK